MFGEIFGVDGIIVLIVVLVLLFGGAAIPKLARSLGSAQTEFKKGLSEGQKGDGTSGDAPDTTSAAASEEKGTTASS